jgi:hypothetical protein
MSAGGDRHRQEVGWLPEEPQRCSRTHPLTKTQGKAVVSAHKGARTSCSAHHVALSACDRRCNATSPLLLRRFFIRRVRLPAALSCQDGSDRGALQVTLSMDIAYSRLLQSYWPRKPPGQSTDWAICWGCTTGHSRVCAAVWECVRAY